MQKSSVRLGILLSGRGSNFLAIAESIQQRTVEEREIAVVISNVADAGGLAMRARLGFADSRSCFTRAASAPSTMQMLPCLHAHDVDLVCLAGYMRLLSPEFIAAFPNRILNIHPSLLPAFPGLDAQEQAFDYGVKVAGCTVHFVDEHLDHGVIMLQRAVPILEGDDAHSLAERILAEEHIAYTEAMERWPAGNTRFADGAMCGAKIRNTVDLRRFSYIALAFM